MQRQDGLNEGDDKLSVHGGDLLCAGWSGEDDQDGGARQYAAAWIRIAVVQPAGDNVHDPPTVERQPGRRITTTDYLDHGITVGLRQWVGSPFVA